MPNRDYAVNTPVLFTAPRRSPRFLRKENPDQEQPTAVRKSSRLLRQERVDKKSPTFRLDSAKDFPKKVNKCCSENVSKRSKKPIDGIRKLGNLSSGSRKPLVLDDGVEGFSNLRRSSRISDQCKVLRERVAKKSGDSSGVGSRNRGTSSSGSVKSPRISNGAVVFQNPRRSPRILSQLSEKRTCNGDSANKKDQFVSNKGQKEKSRNVSVRSQAIVEKARERQALKLECERSIVVEVVGRKRKLDECEENNGTALGWTKEQELALQRAYLTAKPTPRFWKKISRMVPGKSAQDCFDKLNSDYATPPQRLPISRAKRNQSSPIPNLQLSASKVLKPDKPKHRKPSCNKQKSRATHRSARQLLQQHYRQNQVHEADLFSVLEPNLDFSRQPYQRSVLLSTPKQLKGRQEFHQKFNERSSSGHKKPLSRFSASCEKDLASPPVLKTVKNKVLLEKYIDQLHSRDAQRKTASEQARKCSLKTVDRNGNHIQKLNVVLAAKNALVSDARDAITMFQQEQSNGTSTSSDVECDVFNGDGDESDIEL